MNVEQLLEWLDERAKHGVPLVGSIYAGLAARIRRGDFNEER